MSEKKSLEKQLLEAQAEVARCKQKITELEQALDQRTQDINRLIQWMQSLQQDILAVYQSVTWQLGDFIAKIILKILRRPVGVTARDHINKIINSFETWKINYFQSVTSFPYMSWHDTREYRLWIKQFDVLNQSDKEQIQAKMEKFSYFPVISVLILRDSAFIEQTLESIQKQLYPHWEIFLIAEKSPLSSFIKTGDSSLNFEKEQNLGKFLNNRIQFIENREIYLFPRDFYIDIKRQCIY